MTEERLLELDRSLDRFNDGHDEARATYYGIQWMKYTVERLERIRDNGCRVEFTDNKLGHRFEVYESELTKTLIESVIAEERKKLEALQKKFEEL